MAVILTREPGHAVFSRNPVVFQFHTDRRYANVGRAYVGELVFGVVQEPDATMRLLYGENSFDFIFKADPDDSGLELPAWDGSESMAVWRDRVLTALARHYYIHRDYSLDAISDGTIRFTGRTNSQALDLELDDAVGVVLSMTQSAVSAVMTPNLKVLAELHVRDGSGEFVRYSEVALEPDDDGTTTWDISEALTTALLSDGRDRPNLVLPEYEVSHKTSRHFFIRYAEMYGQPQRVRLLHETDTKWGVYGGFSKGMLAERAFPDWFVVGGRLKWMDQSNGQRVVKTKQPDYLYTVNLIGALTSVDVRVKVLFSDNTDVTYTAATFADVPAYGRLIVPSGMEQLGVHLQDANKVAAGYEVWLENAGGVCSETMQYHINYRYEPYMRFFVYENSFGSYEGAYVYGRKSNGYEIIQQSAILTQVADFKLEDGERLDFDVRIQDRERVNTGYTTRRQIRGWRDFFLSTDRYAYKNGRYYPITLVSSATEEFEDGNNLFALGFEVGSRYTESLFTADEETDEYSYTPDLSGYIPAPPADPINFDDRYYLKTQTYNRAEIDSRILALQTAIDAMNTGVAVDLSALWLAVNGKAPVSHTHPQYVTEGDVYELLDDVWIFRGDWVEPDPDAEDSEVYGIGNFVIHQGALWRSTDDDNVTEPGTPGATWEQALNKLVEDPALPVTNILTYLNTTYSDFVTGDSVYRRGIFQVLLATKYASGRWKWSIFNNAI